MTKFIRSLITIFVAIATSNSMADDISRVIIDLENFSNSSQLLNQYSTKQVTHFVINEDTDKAIIVMADAPKGITYQYQLLTADDDEINTYLEQYSPMSTQKVVAWKVYDGDSYIVIAQQFGKEEEIPYMKMYSKPNIPYTKVLELTKLEGAISEAFNNAKDNPNDQKAQDRLTELLRLQTDILGKIVIELYGTSTEEIVQKNPKILQPLLAYSGAKSKYQLALELSGIDKNKIANNALIEMAKQQVIMIKSITQ